MANKRAQGQIDYILLISVLILVGVGIVMVYSASFYDLLLKKPDNPADYYQSSLLFGALGIGAMFIVSFINYKVYKPLTLVIAVAGLGLCIYVLVFGDVINGSRRWLSILGISVMPSEVAKFSFIMVMAAFCTHFKDRLKNLSTYIYFLMILGAFTTLTYLQPDFSTTVLFIFLGTSIVYVAGCHFSHLLLTGFFGAGLGVLAITVAPYRLARLTIWLDYMLDRTYLFDDSRRQIMYSIYAISSGAIKGVGLGMGELKNLRLPEPYNDFIFAIIGEELGFIGSVFILAVFAVVIYRTFFIAMHCQDYYGSLIATGVGFLISYQLLINIGVATNLLPTTGIPLPFVSKGGSSLIILLVLIGIVLNISGQNNLREKKS
jgi:cell division protein FtsW